MTSTKHLKTEAQQHRKKNLYFLPGTMCNQRLWSKLINYLNERYNLVFLSIPNGKSFDELCEYYVDTINDNHIHLIGFSLGGYIASYLSLKHSGLVNKLLIISNSPTALSDSEKSSRFNNLNFITKNGYRGISHTKAASYFDASCQTSELIEIVATMDRELGKEALISQIVNTSEREDLTVQLVDATKTPKTLHFYCSEQDKLVNVKALKALAQSNPKISAFFAPGSGHMLPLERPQELSQQIIQWAEK